MCSSTEAIVAPQKQKHAVDLWHSPFGWRRSGGTRGPQKTRCTSGLPRLAQKAIPDLIAIALCPQRVSASGADNAGRGLVQRSRRASSAAFSIATLLVSINIAVVDRAARVLS
jgi:hypothetical protein